MDGPGGGRCARRGVGCTSGAPEVAAAAAAAVEGSARSAGSGDTAPRYLPGDEDCKPNYAGAPLLRGPWGLRGLRGLGGALALLLLSAPLRAQPVVPRPPLPSPTPSFSQAAERVIVIDPGHGGANVGAPGRSAVYEKQVTLAVARRLRQLLTAQGYRVVMTREDDRYLTLRERVRRANAAQPLLFLSLHANASPDHSQRGIETFILDRAVAEVEARRLAQRAAEPGPQTPPARSGAGDESAGAVAAMLLDISASHWLRESARLGKALQDSLVALRGAVDRGLRQADHDVLSGVQAPAVLVELGFIDHVVEGPLLLEPAIQDQLALALLAGVQRYLGERSSASLGLPTID